MVIFNMHVKRLFKNWIRICQDVRMAVHQLPAAGEACIFKFKGVKKLLLSPSFYYK